MKYIQIRIRENLWIRMNKKALFYVLKCVGILVFLALILCLINPVVTIVLLVMVFWLIVGFVLLNALEHKYRRPFQVNRIKMYHE